MQIAKLIPPFTRETALKKVQFAQDAWNSMDPIRCSLAYTTGSVWRNRDEIFSGRPAIISFLERKWAKEADYKLQKELFAFDNDRIAVQFWYEYRVGKDWFRAYGIEHWTFDGNGLMKRRDMSANDIKIEEGDRWFAKSNNVVKNGI